MCRSVGTSARVSYALGEEREMPSALAKTNKRGVPVTSILVAAVVGCFAFGPFKSWNALVHVVTSASAIMYAFAPIALASLHRTDPDRPRSYRVPLPAVTLPAAFCSANLIIYWSEFPTTWKLACAMAFGLALFAIGAASKRTDAFRSVRNSWWIAPWLVGHVVIGYVGRYKGASDYELLEWVDIAIVVAFSLVIYAIAVVRRLPPEATAEAVSKDAAQLVDLAPARTVDPAIGP